MSFCDDIKTLLREQKLSRGDLAERLETDESCICRWEEGLSLPDAHSLSRLRELFPQAELPEELYSFRLGEKEVRDYFNYFSKKTVKNNALFCLIFFLIALAGIATDISGTKYVAFVGIFIYILLTLSVISRNSKGKKETLERFQSKDFEYGIHSEYVCVTLWDEGSRCSFSSYNYSDAKACRLTKDYIFPLFTTGGLIIPRSAIAPSSLLLSRLDPKTVAARTKGHKALKTVSLVLLILSILAFIAGVVLMSLSSAYIIPPIGLPLTLTVGFFPLATMVFGIVMSVLGRSEIRSAAIIGSILFILLVFINACSPNPVLHESHSDPGAPTAEELIAKAEAAIGTDFPEAVYYDIYKYDDYYMNCYLHHYGYLEFSSPDALKFEETMGDEWMDSVPAEFKVLCDDLEILGYYDSFILCNLDSDEINLLPEEDGTYRFMSVYYDSIYSELYIAEYDVFYVK